MTHALRYLAPLLLLSALLAALFGPATDAARRPGAAAPAAEAPGAALAAAVTADRRALPIRELEASPTALRDPALPSAPEAARVVLERRLGLLGAEEDAVSRLLEGEDLDVLGLSGPAQEKAVLLLEAYTNGRPVSLVGAPLPLEDRLFVGELIAQGFEPEAAAWTLLAAREEGWPASAAQRERLRRVVETATLRPDLREAALDAAVLRREAPNFLEEAEQRRLLAPLDGPLDPPENDAVICRDCPYWNFGLFYPTETWETWSTDLKAGECDVFRFVVEAGKSYRFSLCDGGGEATFNSVLVAKDGLCSPVVMSDDVCGDDAEIDVVAATTGYLYVQVSALDGAAGDYTLAWRRVEDSVEPGACTSCPGYDQDLGRPTTDWQTVDGAIGPLGCRTYRFQLFLNRTYRFSTCAPGSTDFDSKIEIFTTSQSCRPGPFNDDACPGGGSTLDVTAQFTQWATVRVSGQSGAAQGDFTLAYKDVTDECPTCPNYTSTQGEPTAYWGPVSGTVPAGPPMERCDLLRFIVREGHSYRFTTCEGDGTEGTTFQMGLRLLDRDCNFLTQTPNNCGDGATLDYVACRTEYVYLRVQSFDPLGGSYRLMATELCGRVPGCTDCKVQHGPFTATTAWQTLTAPMPSNGCRVHAFELEARKSYRFSLCQGGGGSSPGQQMLMTVRDQDCDLCQAAVGAVCGGEPQVDFTPEEDGTYYVILREVNGVEGDYTLAWREVEADCSDPDFVISNADGRLRRHPPMNGIQNLLAAPRGTRLYRFEGLEPDQIYRFSLCAVDSEGTPAPPPAPSPALSNWILVRMEGDGLDPCTPSATEYITDADCPGELDIVAPASGIIQLKVAKLCAPGGRYRLTYQCMRPRLAFVTSATYLGNLGGLAGADTKCAVRAADSTLTMGRPYLAWLSAATPGGSASPSSRFAKDSVDILRTDGEPIATSWWDLIAPVAPGPTFLRNPLVRTESGNFSVGSVWTNTRPNGEPTNVADDCDEWTSLSGVLSGRRGYSGVTDSEWTRRDFLTPSCASALFLYCFEQPPP